jgi:hypothetical protein
MGLGHYLMRIMFILFRLSYHVYDAEILKYVITCAVSEASNSAVADGLMRRGISSSQLSHQYDSQVRMVTFVSSHVRHMISMKIVAPVVVPTDV